MNGIITLIISLIAGALGGNASAAAVKTLSLGPVGNSIAGAIGGVGLAQLLPSLLPTLMGGDGSSLGAILSTVIGSGFGGAILQMIAGFIKTAFVKQ